MVPGFLKEIVEDLQELASPLNVQLAEGYFFVEFPDAYLGPYHFPSSRAHSIVADCFDDTKILRALFVGANY